MNKNNRIVILHGRVPADAEPDEQDVLVEVEQVRTALEKLGYQGEALSLTLDMEKAARSLRRLEPLAVFNLVESIEGQDRLLHLATALLDFLGIAYTGTGSEGMFLASDKILAKRLLLRAGVPTPAWVGAEEALEGGCDFDPPYLVKSIWDNASRGLEQIFASTEQLREHLEARRSVTRLHDLFVESYIEGREFNLSLLGPELRVLPPAEMLFVDYPSGKPRIVGYAAKWDPASFEYRHTVRRFDFDTKDEGLLEELDSLARKCCHELSLAGYARVDFRVDLQGRPWVLEANPNPCLSADAGLAAAAGRAGLSYEELVECIVRPAVERATDRGLARSTNPAGAPMAGKVCS